MADPLLRLIDISKGYPGVRALSRVSLTMNRGEVLALIGENGAGKSTLMKILGGVVKPDQGTIEIEGAAHGSLTVSESLSSGIAFVHQELNFFDNLDVGANVLIGREPLSAGPLKLVDRKTTKRIVAPLLKRLDVDFEVDDLVSDLSLAQRQLLEIAKALSLNARVVIMDEPTSSLTSTETDRLMRVIGELKADGVSIIFITHRLNEVETCADRVVVLRDGSVVGELARDQIHREAMIRLMIGRDLKSLYIPPKSPPGAIVLEVAGLRTLSHPGHAVSLSLRAGEILGMAGLIGAGRTELARGVFGIDPVLGGEIRLNGALVTIRSAKDAIVDLRLGGDVDRHLSLNAVLQDADRVGRAGRDDRKGKRVGVDDHVVRNARAEDRLVVRCVGADHVQVGPHVLILRRDRSRGREHLRARVVETLCRLRATRHASNRARSTTSGRSFPVAVSMTRIEAASEPPLARPTATSLPSYDG